MCIMEEKMQEQIEAGIMLKDYLDCIKKAVEFAEGFALMHTTTAGAIKYAYPGGSIRVLGTNFPQCYLDALAAQLKRQVDATEFRVGEVDNMSWIEWRKDSEDPRFVSMHNGRTTSSLIVCVEFLTALAERAGEGTGG